MTVAQVSRRLLATTIATRLKTISQATGYVGQIGAMNGLPGAPATPHDPPVKSPDDPRVQPYFVLFPGIGSRGTDADMADLYVDIDWAFTVTAAASDIDDLLALVDDIEGALYRWRPGVLTTTDGPVLTGQITHPVGYIPVPLLDKTITPWRHAVSLQYQLTAHT